ncbi:tail fiber protein [Rhodopseudomonas palustris]|uniref:tail fiber protein n=1 Tax=Rhodopseudomonas palustris TaxID=1076 RepID=UPI000D1AD179|nr:tail fiber protein [Rhodopseudomonas palustris]AVT83660.1 hypothetical protein RPYSC3_48000 [Rhodopseudomonas palustris]
MRSSIVSVGQNGNSGQYNNLRSDAAGGAQLLVHQQSGYFSFPTNPTAGQTFTLTINGNAVVLTCVSSIGSTPGNFLRGATAAASAANALALLLQPQTTTATGVALSAANQLLVSYFSYALVGTTLTLSSNNTNAFSPVTSFSAATNITGGSWTTATMQLYVQPGITTIAGTTVKYAGGSTPVFSAPASNPRIDLVTINAAGSIAIVTGTEAASPSIPAYPVGSTTLAEVYHVVGETALYDTANQKAGQGYIQYDARPFFNITQTVQSGLIMMWPTAPVPGGWLSCDGSAISRATYPTLFGILAPVFGTVTITIATPAVITANSHGLQVGDQIYFTTTGALPTGLSANTLYYIISAGFGANSFQVSTARGGAAVNTSGTQSGTHTMVKCPFGLGDGSTTFNLPDMRAAFPLGYKAGDANAGYYGQKGGEATHTLTTGEMPTHSHDYWNGGIGSGGLVVSTVNIGSSAPGYASQNYGQWGSAGSGNAHNNMPPFTTLLFIIKT